MPLFMLHFKAPRNCRQVIILNHTVQSGRFPDTSGTPTWGAHNSITLVHNQSQKIGSKNMCLYKQRRGQLSSISYTDQTKNNAALK